ncbi:MAG: formate dehydrogenase subunit delta [Xanthomonadales bacterium]|nr:formate dehydrogenase subunit delta [Xanthomonadales bacterium]
MTGHEINELQTLVKMVNQIAANFSFHDDAVDQTLAHLQRFWAPALRQQMIQHVAAGGEGLDDLALQAAQRLTA